MSHRLVARCAPLALVLLALGCDLRQLILESELAPDLRDQLVRECCECLANGQTFVAGDACAGRELPPPNDAGVLVRNPCLCGEATAETCGDVLLAGGVVGVVGGCTASGGQCHVPCDGVLAYP